jgi:hypothetical protein
MNLGGVHKILGISSVQDEEILNLSRWAALHEISFVYRNYGL